MRAVEQSQHVRLVERRLRPVLQGDGAFSSATRAGQGNDCDHVVGVGRALGAADDRQLDIGGLADLPAGEAPDPSALDGGHLCGEAGILQLPDDLDESRPV